MLSFDAYYQEAVVERREEQYRVRKCKIYFYLEDDSIQVIEPRFKNAGVPQGQLPLAELLGWQDRMHSTVCYVIHPID